MPITNIASPVSNHSISSPGESEINRTKGKGNALINFINRITNTTPSLNRVGKAVDSPVNSQQLKNELEAKKGSLNITHLSVEERSQIGAWVGTSESFTTQLPPNLSPYVDTETKALLSALNKMPKFNGVLYRVDDAPGFVNGKIKTGDTIITKRLLSFSSSLEFVKGFAPGRKVFFVLNASNTARDISKINPVAAESVVDINSAFKVKKIITTEAGNMVVHLTENSSQLGYGNAKDLYTGDNFLQK